MFMYISRILTFFYIFGYKYQLGTKRYALVKLVKIVAQLRSSIYIVNESCIFY